VATESTSEAETDAEETWKKNPLTLDLKSNLTAAQQDIANLKADQKQVAIDFNISVQQRVNSVGRKMCCYYYMKLTIF